jgi:hypothetical protein
LKQALDGRCDALERAVAVPLGPAHPGSGGDNSSSGDNSSGGGSGSSSSSSRGFAVGVSVGNAVAALQRTAVALGERLHTKVRRPAQAHVDLTRTGRCPRSC